LVAAKSWIVTVYTVINNELVEKTAENTHTQYSAEEMKATNDFQLAFVYLP